MKNIVKIIILCMTFFASTAFGERIKNLKFHHVIEELGNPYYTSELSHKNATKFMWYDKTNHKFTIVCLVPSNASGICSVDGDIENDSFFNKFR